MPVVLAFTFSLCIAPASWEFKIGYVDGPDGSNAVVVHLYFFAFGISAVWPGE